jgi:hypothetical protein
MWTDVHMGLIGFAFFFIMFVSFSPSGVHLMIAICQYRLTRYFLNIYVSGVCVVFARRVVFFYFFVALDGFF